MKLSEFMENAGISRYSLKYARDTLTWAKSVILCPMMQWQHILQSFLPDRWCCHLKAENPAITVLLKNSFYIFWWDVWYHMDTGISNATSSIQNNAYGKYRVVRWENQRIGGSVYKRTYHNNENSTASCIKLNIDNRITARYWIFKVHS